MSHYFSSLIGLQTKALIKFHILMAFIMSLQTGAAPPGAASHRGPQIEFGFNMDRELLLVG